MPRVKFTRDYKVKPDGPQYRKEQVVEMSEASARHFLDRQAVTQLPDAPAVHAAPPVHVPVEKPKAEPVVEKPARK